MLAKFVHCDCRALLQAAPHVVASRAPVSGARGRGIGLINRLRCLSTTGWRSRGLGRTGCLDADDATSTFFGAAFVRLDIDLVARQGIIGA
jgi:hypothetical protein